MINEELLVRVSNGDEAALTKLCLMNTGLVRDRARLIARRYHCLRQTKYGSLSDYAKEMLSELESVGTLALVECVRAGGYDAEKGRFTTYVTPFLDGAMRRHLECSMGTLALDRDPSASTATALFTWMPTPTTLTAHPRLLTST